MWDEGPTVWNTQINTHTQTHLTRTYVTTESPCGPLPCNISLIGLATAGACACLHSSATPILLLSRGTQLHFQGQGWREGERAALVPGGGSTPHRSIQGCSSLQISLGYVEWLLGLIYFFTFSPSLLPLLFYKLWLESLNQPGNVIASKDRWIKCQNRLFVFLFTTKIIYFLVWIRTINSHD